MSKGSKRPSWKVIRNRHSATTRELAALAGQVPPSYVKPARRIRPPAKAKPERTRRTLTARAAAIRLWYFCGDADAAPPDGLTEAELMRERAR